MALTPRNGRVRLQTGGAEFAHVGADETERGQRPRAGSTQQSDGRGTSARQAGSRLQEDTSSRRTQQRRTSSKRGDMAPPRRQSDGAPSMVQPPGEFFRSGACPRRLRRRFSHFRRSYSGYVDQWVRLAAQGVLFLAVFCSKHSPEMYRG